MWSDFSFQFYLCLLYITPQNRHLSWSLCRRPKLTFVIKIASQLTNRIVTRLFGKLLVSFFFGYQTFNNSSLRQVKNNFIHIIFNHIFPFIYYLFVSWNRSFTCLYLLYTVCGVAEGRNIYFKQQSNFSTFFSYWIINFFISTIIDFQISICIFLWKYNIDLLCSSYPQCIINTYKSLSIFRINSIVIKTAYRSGSNFISHSICLICPSLYLIRPRSKFI